MPLLSTKIYSDREELRKFLYDQNYFKVTNNNVTFFETGTCSVQDKDIYLILITNKLNDETILEFENLQQIVIASVLMMPFVKSNTPHDI